MQDYETEMEREREREVEQEERDWERLECSRAPPKPSCVDVWLSWRFLLSFPFVIPVAFPLCLALAHLALALFALSLLAYLSGACYVLAPAWPQASLLTLAVVLLPSL